MNRKLFILILMMAYMATMRAYAQKDSLLKVAKTEYFEYMYPEGAIQILNNLIKSDSNDAEALIFRSYIYSAIKNYPRAIEDDKKLCRMFPNKYVYRRRLAWHYIMVNDLKTAVLYTQKSFELSANAYQNLLLKAHLSAIKGNMAKAAKEYEIASQYVSNSDASSDARNELYQLKSHGLFSGDLFDKVYDYLLFSYIDYGQYKSSPILDTINELRNEGVGEYSQAMAALKERFIKLESGQSNPRYAVIRDFMWELGLYEYSLRNYEKAISQYVLESLNLTYELGDTTLYISHLMQVGRWYAFYKPQAAINILKAILVMPEIASALHDSTRAENYAEQAEIYYDIKLVDSAFFYARKGGVFARKSKNQASIAQCANTLSRCFAAGKQFDSAIFYNRIAQNANKAHLEIQYPEDEQFCLKLYMNGNYKEVTTLAIKNAIFYESLKSPQFNSAIFYEMAGSSFLQLNDRSSAEMYLLKSISVYKQWLANNREKYIEATTPNRLFRAYDGLVVLAAQKENSDEELFKLWEDEKANSVYEAFTGNIFCDKTMPLQTLKKNLKENELAISFNIMNNPDASYIMAISHQEIKRIKLNLLEQLPALFKKYELTEWADTIESLSRYFARMKGYNSTVSIDESRMAMYIGVAFYTFKHGFSAGNANRGMKILNKTIKEKEVTQFREKINKLLFELLFYPFEKLLENKTRLLIATDGITSFISLAALKDGEGKYLGEKYTLVHVLSFTLERKIAERKTNAGGKILAIGNPDYANFNPGETGRSFDLKAMGFGSWSDLPGTKNELVAIKKQAEGTEIRQFQEVNESWIKQTFHNETNYRIIHLAVHGMSSNTDYRDNSVIMTEPEGSKEDGFLQFDEIRKLKFNAGLVCLSACQTAEASYKRDASLNLSTAFIMAGSRAVIGTLWQIDDEGTALFMKEFYRRASGGNTAYSDVLTQCRQAFISGQFGEKYKDPYYWAPFTYLGAAN
jgi:CHAT domain-containing protein